MVRTLFTFPVPTNGYRPDSGLVLGTDGAFYGTAQKGGAYAHGTLYRITPQGSFSVVHHFVGTNDGADAFSRLVAGPNGVFYGTAWHGGKSNSGTVFEFDPIGTFGPAVTVLHSFSGLGFGTTSGLTMGTNGLLYGSTSGNGFGSLFTVSTAGTYKDFYLFSGTNDGYSPNQPLLQASDGKFYGTAQFGGTFGISNYSMGLGTVFRCDADGSNFASAAFTSPLTGANPFGGLAEGADGNLYGITAKGGTNGLGTIFRVTRNLQITTLYSFVDSGQGEYPNVELLAAKDGFLYGLVPGDSTNNTGTIFRISTNGQYTVLFQMQQTNGEYAVHSDALTQGTDGLIYGVTAYGGDQSSDGTFFCMDTSGTNSVPPSIVSQSYSNGTFILTYNTTPGQTYQILYASTLQGKWTDLGAPRLATTNSATASFPITNFSTGFYKFIAQP